MDLRGLEGHPLENASGQVQMITLPSHSLTYSRSDGWLGLAQGEASTLQGLHAFNEVNAMMLSIAAAGQSGS